MTAFSRLPIRTQLLLATVVISIALTAASLWFARRTIAGEVERQTQDAVRGSAGAFGRIEQQQQAELSQTAAMLSELPILKAVLNTQDAATVQDAGRQFLDLSGADAIIFAGASGRVLGVRTTGGALSDAAAQRLVARSLADPENAGWWQDGNELFRYVERPVVVGAGRESRTVGAIVLARRTTDAVAEDIGRVSGTDVVLVAGNYLVASTLRGQDRARLSAMLPAGPAPAEPRQIMLGTRPYEISAVNLQTGSREPIHALLLFPLARMYAFLDHLTRIIVALGLLAVIIGAVLVTLLAGAITRPLENLVAGAQALASGNYSYAIRPRGSAEVAGLGTAFVSMRQQLLDSQRRQLDAERMAALGRAASSISHDLRHHLAALVANAEFLRDADELRYNRDDIYREIQQATEQMTGLIDSLIEVARDRNALSRSSVDLAAVIQVAVDNVRHRPEFRDADIRLEIPSSGAIVQVDARKLQRAFFNLLLNACEATTPGRRCITIAVSAGEGGNTLCRVTDTGAGIPESIRGSLFEPFVSEGKSNGTGLGLAIAKKIIDDHDGSIAVERTSSAGTTFVITLPLTPAAAPAGSAQSSLA